MTTSKCTIRIAAACVGLAALLTYAGAAQPLKVDFSDEYFDDFTVTPAD